MSSSIVSTYHWTHQCELSMLANPIHSWFSLITSLSQVASSRLLLVFTRRECIFDSIAQFGTCLVRWACYVVSSCPTGMNYIHRSRNVRRYNFNSSTLVQMAQEVRGGHEKPFQCDYVCHDVSVVGTKGGAMLLPK